MVQDKVEVYGSLILQAMRAEMQLVYIHMWHLPGGRE